MMRQTMQCYFIQEEKKKWISVFITMGNVNLFVVLPVLTVGYQSEKLVVPTYMHTKYTVLVKHS